MNLILACQKYLCKDVPLYLFKHGTLEFSHQGHALASQGPSRSLNSCGLKAVSLNRLLDSVFVISGTFCVPPS